MCSYWDWLNIPVNIKIDDIKTLKTQLFYGNGASMLSISTLLKLNAVVYTGFAFFFTQD